MPDDVKQSNQAVDSYLGALKKDILVKLPWEQWLEIGAPYPATGFKVEDVTTRYHRNGYDWVMHAKVYTPDKELDAKLGMFMIHGGAGSANNMDHTPDGRPGMARVVAAQGIKVVSCSFTGHYPKGGTWKKPVAERMPDYLYGEELSDAEIADRNIKCTFNVNMQGAAALVEQHLKGQRILAFGHSTGGPMAAHLQKWLKTATVIGLCGFGTGGPDGWKHEWAESIGYHPKPFPIDHVSRRSVKTYKEAGYEDPEDLCPWGGPGPYMEWADKAKSQMKTAMCDNQHNGCTEPLEEAAKKTGLPRAEFFDHFEDPDPKFLKSISVLLLAGENDKGHWVKGGDKFENKREGFVALKYKKAGVKRVNVVAVPRYGHVGYAELYNEKFAYLWLWAFKTGYFS
jgi:pimeloyl-ACP methyl ester carboxylesterase